MMADLPPIPADRDWNEATWRAGLDEAVRRNKETRWICWDNYVQYVYPAAQAATIAHAITLLDAGIVQPVVSEAEQVWLEAYNAQSLADFDCEDAAAIAVIQAALDKARAGE